MIRLAIVGTGRWANNHAEAWGPMRGVRMVACCDVDKAKARAFAKRHGIEAVYDDYRQLLAEAELDALDVVAPDTMHAEITLAALRAGCHVMCEKPLATTAVAARKMVRTAQRLGRVNMVNFAKRNGSALHKARTLIAEGRLGQIIHVEAGYLQSWLSSRIWGDWRKDPGWLWRLSTKHGSGGVLYDIGCHLLDFATYAVGDIRRLACKLATFDKGVGGTSYKGYTLDANDSAIITVTFENGAIGTLRCTRWASGYVDTLYLHVFGTRGGLRINLDDGGNQLELSAGTNLHKGKWKTIRCRKGKTNYRRFIEAIRAGAPASPDFADGLRIQTLLERCVRASRTNREITV